jgi:quinoprotein glucose dehydrogenase
MYVMSKEQPALLKLRVLGAGAGADDPAAGDVDADPRGPDPRLLPPNLPPGFVPYGAVAPYGFMLDPATQLPPIGPPWSQITAYDLNKGTILWQIPNGETPQLVERGVTNTGSQSARAGMVVTAGGLIFIGTPDRKLRAYDQDTGKVVWTKELTGPINGVPAVYEVNGREYLAVCVGTVVGRPSGRGQTATPPPAGEYVVFALPNK